MKNAALLSVQAFTFTETVAALCLKQRRIGCDTEHAPTLDSRHTVSLRRVVDNKRKPRTLVDIGHIPEVLKTLSCVFHLAMGSRFYHLTCKCVLVPLAQTMAHIISVFGNVLAFRLLFAGYLSRLLMFVHGFVTLLFTTCAADDFRERYVLL